MNGSNSRKRFALPAFSLPAGTGRRVSENKDKNENIIYFLKISEKNTDFDFNIFTFYCHDPMIKVEGAAV
jgi:hypothetical protein